MADTHQGAPQEPWQTRTTLWSFIYPITGIAHEDYHLGVGDTFLEDNDDISYNVKSFQIPRKIKKIK